ncbi:MAG: hypothetical protein M0Q14_02875 [Tissierellaceae bacterium]|nr:hypothetical protein [Tissierellaceae bacterium]
MAKIRNIGVLDVREIGEEIAKKISSIEGIGILIESDKSQDLLRDVKRANIGVTLKLPSDKRVSLAMQNGELNVDREYLEGIEGQVAFIVNGELIFNKDVKVSLLNEKLFSILLNGVLICPKKLLGSIQSKGTINGAITPYSSDYNLIRGKIQLNNRFLKTIKRESKLSFEKLLILEDFDAQLFEERVSDMEVLDKLVILEKYEDKIAQYIDNYYSINNVVLPNRGVDVKYVDGDVKIDSSFLSRYENVLLYIDGNVSIDLEDDTDFGSHVNLLMCNEITCNKKTYHMIKYHIGEDVEVKIQEGRLIQNMGKMTLREIAEGQVSIRNMGKLIIDENLDMDKFTESVVEIVNYGVVEAPQDKLAMVESKITINNGKVRISKKQEEKVEVDEDVLYEGMGELKL